MKKISKRQRVLLVAIAVVCIVLSAFKVHAMLEQQYTPLSGLKIVLDPGHGGKDDGARAVDAKEQEINLKIALKLQIHLQKAGAEVLLTRDGAYDLASDSAKNRKREDMEKRVSIINENDNDMFLSIHLNAFPNVSVKGAQAFYGKGNESEKVLADIIQRNFNTLTGRDLTSKTGDYYILNKTKKVGVLVECGFISNEQDRENLLRDDYQEKVAQLLYDSVAEYLQIVDN